MDSEYERISLDEPNLRIANYTIDVNSNQTCTVSPVRKKWKCYSKWLEIKRRTKSTDIRYSRNKPHIIPI